jgi:hypothetical protein
MPKRRVKVDPRVLEHATSAGESESRSVELLRERFGLEKIEELARESVGRGDHKTALALTCEARELTGEVLQTYGRRGFDVAKIGRDLERTLGDRNFAGAEKITQGDTPAEVLETAFAEIGKAWSLLAAEAAKQTTAKVEKKLKKPETEETIQERVEREMKAVWKKKAEGGIKLGSEVEELRSGVGLRTLSALISRYGRRDSEGREEAMQAAYAWSRRAYWLTKHSIRQYELASPNKPGVQEQLHTLGGKFEDWLGHSDLAHYGESSFGEAPKIAVEERGWTVVKTTEETVRQTWQEMKKIVRE